MQKSAMEQLRLANKTVQGLSALVKDEQWDSVIEALTKLEELDVAGTGELASIAGVAAICPFLRHSIK